MKELFDQVSTSCSKITTQRYSTSFSLGIKLLSKRMHAPVYAIYGFVRFADEIVDSFHAFDKAALLGRFREDTYTAVKEGISLNPILNSFQKTVKNYDIEKELIDTFLDSMEMDLSNHFYSRRLYDQYVLGSAEVVGLMCLKVFCEGNRELYEKLKTPAMKLGAAFQKINFLRDVKVDKENLGRTYFPGIDLANFSSREKQLIEEEISMALKEALAGIRQLPLSSRRGVYLAYKYYLLLFKKIRNASPQKILNERIRVPDIHKVSVMCKSVLRCELNML
ncbi:MAG: phytoene/squalene synthase family protein [Chitinophagaceae bacterium]|nr:phytoene/squalene synthase family protein [Chitinophagaceae bacterium]MCW5927916.1 phytoene/squalene synthase family protein [Chitinophagaceae bacterium]